MSIRTFGAPLAVAAAALTAAAYAATGSASPNANALVAGGPVNGGTLQAAMVSNPDHLDPALAYTTETWEILSATNDGLVTFRRVAGAASSQIVPDLATAMPTISDHGLTYTFHVRTGVMFSPPSVARWSRRTSSSRSSGCSGPTHPASATTPASRVPRPTGRRRRAGSAASWRTTLATRSSFTCQPRTARSSSTWRCRSRASSRQAPRTRTSPPMPRGGSPPART